MERSPLRMLVLSDVHFGAGHINPDDEYYRLNQVVTPYFDKIDLFVLSGDYFDNALLLDNTAAVAGMAFLFEIVKSAKHHGFAIRIIRGTYTHDRDQLDPICKLATKEGIDFGYYTEVAVGEVRGYSFLYLPDNLSIPATEVMEHLPDLLKDHGGTVDVIIGHGYCEHVLPSVLSAGKHIECFNADILLKYTRYCVVFGHVHTSSVYKERVLYVGSFDRLCHGEEEAKGCLYLTLGPMDEFSVEGVNNPFATPHITVYLTKDTIEDCVKEVKDAIKARMDNPPRGYVRIAGDENRKFVRSILTPEYAGDIVFTELDTTKKQRSTQDKLETCCFKTFTGDVITRENIAPLLFRYLTENINDFDLTEEDIRKGLMVLQQG